MDYLEIRELYHHGIKGQRWGVRRYQQEDGTLTAEGKARYGIDSNGKMSKEGKKLFKQDVHDQKVLDRTPAKNALIEAGKSTAKYVTLAYGGATLVGALIGKLTLNGVLPLDKTMIALNSKAVDVGGWIVTGLGLSNIAYKTVKGAKEKESILKSQKENGD